MNIKVLMRLSAIVVAALTIYLVVLWQPTTNAYEDAEVVKTEVEKSESTNLGNSDNHIGSGEVTEDIIELDNTMEGNQIANNEDVVSNSVATSVDLNSIVEELAVVDRNKVNSILKKLSVSDYYRFMYMLTNEDNNGGVAKAFALLKRRATEDDFKIIEELLNEYIDFSIIDTKV